MIDYEKLTSFLSDYKRDFPGKWKDDELFKWRAVKHFQDHWDPKAEDFASMFKEATLGADSLLGSGYAYPKQMILNFAQKDATAVRAMFADLYDESKSIATRVESFRDTAEELRSNHDDSTWRQHYQNTNYISVYLWLRYPDKYFFYKYDEYRHVSEALNSTYRPKKNGSVQTMLGGFTMYDELRAELLKDAGIRKMLDAALTNNCYSDPELRTMTLDLGFYISQTHKRRIKEKEMRQWGPADYDPGLSVEDWRELLDDNEVFNDNAKTIMRRMLDYGGQATCTQLSLKYGASKNFYNSGSVALAKRVAKKTGCTLLQGGEENSWYWPVLYLGRQAEKDADGSYVWRLRDELKLALEQVDLSDISLYAERGEVDEQGIETYTKEDFLCEVYMDSARYETLVKLLRNKMNIILQGAPGVGKTFTARRLAWSMMGERDDSRIELVQFHQSYSYEDFVLGYRPDGTGFQLMPGVFYQFCEKAASSPDKDFFFIIDEINRGNISKIFGELLMLIEKDYRGTSAKLAYDRRTFTVPRNVYIIGMMNTADRSLALIDYALRRRFGFYAMEPAFHTEGFQRYQKGLADDTLDTLIETVQRLNRSIADDDSLGPGFCIGHSYFCGRAQGDIDEDWLHSVVEFDIIPTLQEYWFEERETFDKWSKELRSVFDDG